MSLNWNIGKTQAWNDAGESWEKMEQPTVVDTVIRVMPIIGVGSITAKNVNDVIARIRYFEALRGCLLIGFKGKDMPIPDSIIRSLIGLTTNASNETTGQFYKRIAANWFRDTVRQLETD